MMVKQRNFMVLYLQIYTNPIEIWKECLFFENIPFQKLFFAFEELFSFITYPDISEKLLAIINYPILIQLMVLLVDNGQKADPFVFSLKTLITFL